MSYVQIGLQIVLMFFVLVTLHEWGHFYFAKRAGILVREFAIGFGPKLVSFRRNETKYTLRLLPIGGFVRMAGEDPEIVEVTKGQTIGLTIENGQVTHIYLDKLDQRSDIILGEVAEIDMERELFVELAAEGDKIRYPIHPQAMLVARGQETQIAPWDRQFNSKPVRKRAMAIFAGPLMNFILAFVLFLTFMFLNGKPVNVTIGEIVPGSPAEAAELQAGDVIVRVNGETIGIERDRIMTLISENAGQPMTWIIERDQEQLQKVVTPRTEDSQGALVGVTLAFGTQGISLGEALPGAWDNMVMATEQILTGFKMLLFGQFTFDDLGGPVRIVEVSGEYAAAGIAPMVFWSALLSLYLGIFNLLPIPALDGSRLVFLGIEAIRRKPVDPNRESLVHFIGFAMLMLLMIAVTYNDIVRLIKG
ncbi:RIP metalloprotease RseP [Paenibacillus senegalensis]|uniref:RIP metalloprotease RseP n=1 Tax=Paenibacillus senegalensis TaxID=1465766 RepID=UPI00028A0D50|nr:RIP metalloprotease RseP [Paenibacillus senegalensis]